MLRGALVDERGLHEVGGVLACVGPLVEVELGRCLTGNGAVSLGAAHVRRATSAHADIAGHGRQRRHGPERLERVVRALHALAHADARRLCLGVLAGECLYDFGVEASDARRLLDGVFGRTVLQVGERRLDRNAIRLEGALDGRHDALRIGGYRHARSRIPHHVAVVLATQILAIVVTHEQRSATVRRQVVLIVQVVGDDPVDHAHSQCRVRAGLDGNPLVGDGGRAAEARVDVDDLAATLARPDDVAQL